MRASATAAAVAAITLGLTGWVGSPRANAGGLPSGGFVTRGPEHRPPARTARSSGLILGGRVRCTATVGSEVQAGRALSVRFTLRNLSKRPVKVPLWVFSTRLVVRAADGTSYDTSEPLQALPGIPPPIPTKIRPGATKSLGRLELPVRWNGPLRITPECEGKPLHVLRVAVTAPWPSPDESTAIDDVVAASGHLLDKCRPQTSGVAVDGEIDPPSGNDPPMSARCSVSISSPGTFWVAQVLVLVPPGLQGVTVLQPYEVFGPPYGLDSPPPWPAPPFEAIAWEFVVTKNGAFPVASATVAASNSSSSGQMDSSFSWNGKAWQGGGGSCGGRMWAWGGRFPTVEFISACPS